MSYNFLKNHNFPMNPDDNSLLPREQIEITLNEKNISNIKDNEKSLIDNNNRHYNKIDLFISFFKIYWKLIILLIICIICIISIIYIIFDLLDIFPKIKSKSKINLYVRIILSNQYIILIKKMRE